MLSPNRPVLAAAMLCLVLGACGSASTSAASSVAAGTDGGGGDAVRIVNFAFAPQHLTVPAGTAVRWTNGDTATHTVTADAGGWDSGNLTTGATFTVRFATPGTFTYHCGIHTYMIGSVTATPPST